MPNLRLVCPAGSGTGGAMIRRASILLSLSAIAVASVGRGQIADQSVLPAVTVYSPRVANQSPTATFAMPVSALRFEPRVDLQSRNFAESQSDVTIRGGIFENTGFTIGAVSLFDPQTGHYFAEIPVAPVKTIPQAAEDPHLWEREMLVKMPDALAGEIHVPGATIKMSKTPGRVGHVPTPGEHTDEVLSGLLGYNAASLRELREAKVIG